MSNNIQSTSRNGKLYQLKVSGTGTAKLLGRDAGKFTLTDNGTGNYTLTPVNALSEPPIAFGISSTDTVKINYSVDPTSTAITFKVKTMPIAERTARLSLNGIDFTSILRGIDGNLFSVTITDGATAGSEVVTSTSVGAITIQVQSGVSTATQVYAALKAKTDGTLSAFVGFYLYNDALIWSTASAVSSTSGILGVAAVTVDADFDVLLYVNELNA